MLCSQKQLGGAIPNGYDDFVSGKQRLEWLVGQTGETEVSDFDDSAGGYEDVCGFEVAVDDVGVVKVQKAVEELEGQRLEDGRCDRTSEGLGVVVDHLLHDLRFRQSIDNPERALHTPGSRVRHTQTPYRLICPRV